MEELKSFPLGQWNYPEELPTHNDSEIVICLVIVQGVQTGIVRVEEAEYRYGEWAISSAWNLLAWNIHPAPEKKPLTMMADQYIATSLALHTVGNGWKMYWQLAGKPYAHKPEGSERP